MPLAEFEPAIPASERSQTHALDGATNGIGHERTCSCIYMYEYKDAFQTNVMWHSCAWHDFYNVVFRTKHIQSYSKWLSGSYTIHSRCDPIWFILWGYVKDQVHVPLLPVSIPELKVRIRTANETITADMLQTVQNEVDYRVDVCRITKGANIEHL